MASSTAASSWSKDGPWHLPIRGFQVSYVTFGLVLTDIVAYGEHEQRIAADPSDHAPSVNLRFEGEFGLIEPGGPELLLSAETQEWADLAPVLALRRDRIVSFVATSDGVMNASFESGRRLVAGPHAQYESWEVSGPGYVLVCPPGGRVSLWTPSVDLRQTD